MEPQATHRAVFGVCKTMAEAESMAKMVKAGPAGVSIVVLYPGVLGGDTGLPEPIGYLLVPSGYECPACGK